MFFIISHLWVFDDSTYMITFQSPFSPLRIFLFVLMSIITDFLEKVYNKLLDIQDANNYILYAKSLNNDDEDEECFGLFM